MAVGGWTPLKITSQLLLSMCCDSVASLHRMCCGSCCIFMIVVVNSFVVNICQCKSNGLCRLSYIGCNFQELHLFVFDAKQRQHVLKIHLHHRVRVCTVIVAQVCCWQIVYV